GRGATEAGGAGGPPVEIRRGARARAAWGERAHMIGPQGVDDDQKDRRRPGAGPATRGRGAARKGQRHARHDAVSKVPPTRVGNPSRPKGRRGPSEAAGETPQPYGFEGDSLHA